MPIIEEISRNRFLVCFADSRNANFRRADIREGVNFTGANLEEAQMGFADLQKSDFKDTSLRGVDFRCANLRDVSNLPIQDLAGVKSLFRAEMDESIKTELQKMRKEPFAKPSDPWHDMTTPYNIGKKDICE